MSPRFVPRLFRCLAPAVVLAFAAAAGARASAPLVSLPPPEQPGAGQIFYFVLTDRFANGDPANDTGGEAGGPEKHGFDPALISHFHGGDLAGLTSKIDYIKGLGATAIWLTPPFRNKPVQSGSAGYHGYWILDFLRIDPHLGTNDEFNTFVSRAHGQDIRVFLDVILNHTADVITPEGGDLGYRDRTTWPYRDAEGRPFDEREHPWNGIGEPRPFPGLSAEVSFPHRPLVPEAERNAKNPAWLNDVRFYHNRGNTNFTGEQSMLGDFAGLDDLFTERPEVVRGMIDIYGWWIRQFRVDGFRIDTAKHTNLEVWQAFGPAMQAAAREAGLRSFFSFAEVASDDIDPALLSEFTTLGTLEGAIDFSFAVAARDYVGRGGTAAALARVFEKDDFFTDHDSTAATLPIFLGNHDQGRFAHFLQRYDPGADAARLLQMVRLGHVLLLTARGQPVLYYGDEQGMIGRGGWDMQAREDMFASRAPDFRDASLLGTSRTGADDKFDRSHPLYEHIATLTALRRAHRALSHGAMLLRRTDAPQVFAFSRIDREERIEYVVALNNSRVAAIEATVPTSQPPGARLQRLYRLDGAVAENSPAAITIGEDGAARFRVPALGAVVWRAEAPLPVPHSAPSVTFVSPPGTARLAFSTRETDGQAVAERQAVEVEVRGGDGFAEVTFLASRGSRPEAYEYLGTDNAPPYRVFWRPPPDWGREETVSFFATVDDLRGHRATAGLPRVVVVPPLARSGVAGASAPRLLRTPPPRVEVGLSESVMLEVQAEGIPAPVFQWFCDGVPVEGQTGPALQLAPARLPGARRFVAMARNVAGAAVSREIIVSAGTGEAGAGRLMRLPPIGAKLVAERPVDVWLPPGYEDDGAKRYPVVYMHDGQNLFAPGNSFGGVAWQVDRAMERLLREQRVRPAIIVGVWNTGNRTAEYMPQKAVGLLSPAQIGGLVSPVKMALSSDRYVRYLVEELKPVIDRTFRTSPSASDTFVMGSSMGGLISAYAVSEYPQVFGGAGCLSSHWPAGDGAVIEYLRRHLPPAGAHRFYFDLGSEGLDAAYEPYQRRMDEVLRAAGYQPGPHAMTRRFPGEEHSERAWAARVEIPLEFLLGR